MHNHLVLPLVVLPSSLSVGMRDEKISPLVASILSIPHVQTRVSRTDDQLTRAGFWVERFEGRYLAANGGISSASQSSVLAEPLSIIVPDSVLATWMWSLIPRLVKAFPVSGDSCPPLTQISSNARRASISSGCWRRRLRMSGTASITSALPWPARIASMTFSAVNGARGGGMNTE